MKKIAMFVLGLALTLTISVANINTIKSFAITQDEMAAMVEEQCAKDGLDINDYKTTGGTANVAGGQVAIEKAEEVQKKNAEENIAPQPTKVLKPIKAVEEQKTEVVETEVEPTVEEPTTTEEITTTEEETTTEEIRTTEEPITIEESTTTEEETTIVEEQKTTKGLPRIIAIAVIVAVAVTVFLFGKKFHNKK